MNKPLEWILWDQEVLPIMQRLCNGQYSLIEIQKLFDEGSDMVGKQYGIGFTIHPVDHLSAGIKQPREVFIPSTAFLQEPEFLAPEDVSKIPMVILNIKFFFEFWNTEKAKNPFRCRYLLECMVALSILHELDHLLLGAVMPPNFKEFLDYESRAWAMTCDKALNLFLGFYQSPFPQEIVQTYVMWQQCKRNDQSSLWVDHIAAIHKNICKAYDENGG